MYDSNEGIERMAHTWLYFWLRLFRVHRLGMRIFEVYLSVLMRYY